MTRQQAINKIKGKRFIVTGDWHIGLVTKSRDVDGIPDRHKELMESISYILKYAVEHKVDFVVVVGDIFHINTPSQLYYADLLHILHEFDCEEIPLYMIPGNHDAINTIPEMNALRSIFKSKFKNLTILNKIERVELVDELDMVFVPHVNRCEYSVFNEDAENTMIETRIKDLGIADRYKIVFGHAMLPNSIVGAERTVMRGGEQSFRIKVDDTLAYFFGHMHTPQIMQWLDVPLYYPGAIQTCDFGERDDEKSFIDVTVEKDLEVTRIKVPTRKFLQIEINSFKEYKDIFSPTSELPEHKDCIIKIHCSISSEDKLKINEEKMRKRLTEAYWIDVEYNIKRVVSTRNIHVTAEADPEVTFEKWYRGKGYSEDRFKKLAKLNRDIMSQAADVGVV